MDIAVKDDRKKGWIDDSVHTMNWNWRKRTMASVQNGKENSTSHCNEDRIGGLHFFWGGRCPGPMASRIFSASLWWYTRPTTRGEAALRSNDRRVYMRPRREASPTPRSGQCLGGQCGHSVTNSGHKQRIWRRRPSRRSSLRLGSLYTSQLNGC